MLFIVLLCLFILDTDGCCRTCSCNGSDIECRGTNRLGHLCEPPDNTTKLGIYHVPVTSDRLEKLLANLSELTNLTITDTRLDSMSETLFSGLTNLQELQLLSSSHIARAESGVFLNLKRLQRFRISDNNKIHFYKMSKYIMNLDAPMLNTVIIDRQGTKTLLGERPILSSAFYRLFLNKSVSTLVLTNNFIQRVRPGFSTYFERIKCLILQGNIITRDWTALYELIFMRNLRFIDMSHQGRLIDSHETPDINKICMEPLPLSTEVWELTTDVVRENHQLMAEHCHTVIRLSPQVRYVFLRDIYPGLVKSPFTTYCFHPQNRIRYIDASHNTVDYKRHSIGLLRLQYYNLQYNRITRIRYHTFAHYPSLNTLLLGGNQLGRHFMEGNATFALRKLGKLTSLDLAGNGIGDIARDDLQFLMRIANVNLSGNGIHPRTLNKNLTIEFKFLNLSNNKLTGVPKLFRRMLERSWERLNYISQVDLSGNSFICTCDSLDFLDWLIVHKKYLHNFDLYQCAQNSDFKWINDDMTKQLQYACRKNATSLIIGTVFGFVTLVITALICYRHKNQMNYYLVFLPYLQWKRYRLKSENYVLFTNETTFDIFIVYNYLDRQFVCDIVKPNIERRGLSVCVGEDEFIAGEYITDCIAAAINSCRCTLVIVSKNLQTSKWCNYEIAMSLAMEKCVTVLSADNLQARHMCPGIIHLSRQTRHIYPVTSDDEMKHKQFWDKLVKGLKDKMITTKM